jgi:tetratricopeptide (TPR) repeat protein
MNNVLTKYRSFWICLVLTLATTAVFYQVWTYDFVYYDDTAYVCLNPDIQAGITLKAIKWAFTTDRASNWHPITWLSHILDWQLFGSNAGGHHLTNLVFHIANTLILFYVLMRMTGAVWPSAFVAALFALHPLHVESVAWISERKDLLSTFLWLLTMWAYVYYVSRPKIGKYLLVVMFLILGLMAKPMLVTLPFVFLLLDYWPLNRLISRCSLIYLVIEKIPLFAMVFVLSIVAFIVQKKGGAIHTEDYSFSVRLANASISYMQYIIKMIWPVHLAVFYPHPDQNVSVPIAVISAVFLLIVTVLVIRFAGNHKYLVTGWFWYLGTLVPVIGLIQVGSHAMADRYTYMTLTGLFIIIAFSAKEFVPKQRYKMLVLPAVAVLIILSVITARQVRYWKNSITMFEHTLAVTENNYNIRFNYTYYLCKLGRFDETIEQFEELLKFKSDSATHSDFGIALLHTGRVQDAVEHFRLAMKYDPNCLPAHFNLAVALQDQGRLDEAVGEYRKYLQIKPDDPNALNALGTALGQQGKLDEAVKYLTQALRIDPNSGDAHTNLGYALTFQGKLDEAVVHLAKALRLDPNSAKAHYYFGKALSQKNKIDEAVAHFEEALRLKPDWVEPMNDLAWYLAASKETAIRNPDKALGLALRACELTDYKRPELLDTLSTAYAATGAFDKAVETAQKALELCRSSEQEKLKEMIKNRQDLYKAGKPYIENE